MPFFEAMTEAPHWEAVKFCTRATVGDTAIALIAFWGAAVIAGSRDWIRQQQTVPSAAFIAIGVGVTAVLEHVATGSTGRWTYSDLMPIVPILQMGCCRSCSGWCCLSC